jgi:hypothetical protein
MKIHLFFMLICVQTWAQTEELPYREIPDYPKTYTGASVAARLVDGLGFRYFWATEGLREEDLRYRPGDEARSSLETLEHIFGLSEIMVNSVYEKPTDFTVKQPVFSFTQLREKTLRNLKDTSDKLKLSTDADLVRYKMIFKRATGTAEFPFWNEINGPIADALWHIGQVVSFRRASGNPFNNKANVLTGKLVE